MNRLYSIALVGGLPSGNTVLMSLTAAAPDSQTALKMAQAEMQARCGASLKFHGNAVSDITEEAQEYIVEQEATNAR